MGPWECMVKYYSFIRKGEINYPTGITDNTIGFYIKDVGKVIWYSKKHFEELPFQYNPDQVGDTEDDI